MRRPSWKAQWQSLLSARPFRGIVVLGLAPRDDVGRLDRSGVIWGEDAEAAECASVVVGLRDSATKSLIPHGFADVFRFVAGQVFSARPAEEPTLPPKDFHVERALFGDGALDRFGEVSFD